MKNQEILNTLEEIKKESYKNKGNYQIQTELVNKLILLSDEIDNVVHFYDYLSERDIYSNGSDVFDLTLEELQSGRFLDFSTIIEDAKLIAYFGDHTELMEIALLEYDHGVTPVDCDDIDDMTNAIKDALEDTIKE